MFYILKEMRKNVLVKGMQQDHRGKGESFMMNIFKKYDKKNLGYIERDDMERAILSIPSLKLTRL